MATYHVMNRGSSRQEIFSGRRDYETFLKTLAEIHDLWGVEVFAYCLMGNHYHVCLRTPEGNLSRVMRHLNGLYTQRFNRAHHRDGPLFRGRYTAIVVDADEYLAAVVRYIHLNPVEGGLVQEPQSYQWSSHAAYLRPHKVPKWLKVADLLEQFLGVKGFHQFVLSGNEKALKEFYSQSRRSPLLGGERFRERFRGRLGKLSREHPRHEKVGVRPSVDRVMSETAEVYGTDVGALVKCGRGKEREARKVAMYLVNRLCGLTLQQTAEQFGIGSYGAVGWACHGVRSKLESDNRFRKEVERIEAKVYQQKT
ncbi:MAG: transposase [Deltaproteobacteria bacterium]|nr:transposase [Deltaproteobacteria bacterium]